ncbi:hypothetical protein JXQ70_00535 [bacterium]|nr:hypothetical protein [bacterium]
MMKMNYFMALVLTMVGLCSVQNGVAAFQSGALIALSALTPSEQDALLLAIKQARTDEPDAFAAVKQVRDNLAELDAVKRGRLAVITPLLKSIGEKALYPLLEHIAVSDPGPTGLTTTAWLAWQLGLLEAVGMLRDGRTAPVLRAVIQSEQHELEVFETAVAAYAKLATDRVVQDLLELSSCPEPKRASVLAGMGFCRRLDIARHLATTLQENPDQNTALIVARALGRIGSALAWQTEIIALSGQEGPVRTMAARSLVEAYLRFSPEVQKMIIRSLLMIDHPDTLDYIQELRMTTNPDRYQELDQLIERFQKSPLRRIRTIP